MSTHGQQLPQELMCQVFQGLESISYTDYEVRRAMFAACRLVNKNTKELVEELLPEELDSFCGSVASRYMRDASLSSSDALAQLEVVKKARSLYVRVGESGPRHGRGAQGLNTLLETCTKLEELFVAFSGDGCKLGDVHLSRSNLRSLDISDVRRSHRLQELDLSQSHGLETLSLSQDQLDDDLYYGSYGDPPHVGPPRRLPPNLTKLEVKYMAVPATFVQQLLPVSSSITELDLSFSTGLRGLGLAALKSLRTLRLDDIEANNATVDALMSPGSQLEALYLSHNAITDPLRFRLDSNSSLKTLDISGNPITHLDLGLASNSTLERLSIGSRRSSWSRDPGYGSKRKDAECTTKLSDAHFGRLSDQLKANNTLSELFLSRCRGDAFNLDVEGASIKLLDVSESVIFVKEVQKIGLERNTSLTEVRLPDTEPMKKLAVRLSTKTRSVRAWALV